MTEYEQVREFMLMFGQECPSSPIIPPKSVRELRWKLINEEGVIEIGNAVSRLDKFDAILDTRYVTYGAAIAYGHPEDCLSPRFHTDNYLGYWNDRLLYAESHTAILHSIIGILSWISCKEAEFFFTCSQVNSGFSEVHRSNMSKLWNAVELESEHFKQGYSAHATYWVGGNRYIVKDASGKIIKSPSYSPANLRPILEGGV